MAYNSNDSEKDDHSKCKEGNECIGLDIRVSVLIHLHQNYTTSDEHEGSICVRVKMKLTLQLKNMAYQTGSWHCLDKCDKRNS